MPYEYESNYQDKLDNLYQEEFELEKSINANRAATGFNMATSTVYATAGGCVAGGTIGALFGGVGAVPGCIIGASVGFFTSLIGAGIQAFSFKRRAKTARRLDKELKTLSDDVEDETAENFENLKQTYAFKKEQYLLNSEKNMLSLKEAQLRSNIAYKRSAADLSGKYKASRLAIGISIRDLNRGFKAYKAQDDYLNARYQTEKASIESQYNILTHNYTAAQIAKDAQALQVVQAKQQQRLQTLQTSKTGLSASQRTARSSTQSLKMLSNMFGLANRAEQLEQDMLSKYQQALIRLEGRGKSLEHMKTNATLRATSDFTNLANRTAQAVDNLSARYQQETTRSRNIAEQLALLSTGHSALTAGHSARIQMEKEQLDLLLSSLAHAEQYNAANIDRKTYRHLQKLMSARHGIADNLSQDSLRQAQQALNNVEKTLELGVDYLQSRPGQLPNVPQVGSSTFDVYSEQSAIRQIQERQIYGDPLGYV